MTSAATLAAVVCAMALASLATATTGTPDPPNNPNPPPPLPAQYYQRFTMSDGSSGEIHYDYTNLRQRVSHFDNTAQRSNQCFFWFNTTTPCIEYFVDRNMFVFFPEDGSCCLESCTEACDYNKMNSSDGSCCREPEITPPKPDSVSACAFNGTVPNNRTAAGVVDWWHCPACLNYYYTTSDPQQAVSFFSDDHGYEVDFDIPSLSPGPQPDELFVLPAACTQDVKCKGFVASPKLVC